MRPLAGVLLLLLTCQLATSTPILDRDGRSGFGETIRDWFRELKDRIVGKWQEWFGKDNPTPRISTQDILNIDKILENRVPGYPGLFLDLSRLSFDSKRDWGVRIGKWYIIRKVTESNYKDSDSDEWDLKPFLGRHLPPLFGNGWTPDFSNLPTGIPEDTQSPTTPRIQSTTWMQQTTQPVTRTQVLTSTESTVTTTEATESIPLTTTQLIKTFVQPIEPTSAEEISTSNESVETNSEPVTAHTESMLTSTELITESTIPSTESTVITTGTVMRSTEELTTITTTESPETSTELILPLFNKRVEENETIDKQTTKKPRPASAEVIMF